MVIIAIAATFFRSLRSNIPREEAGLHYASHITALVSDRADPIQKATGTRGITQICGLGTRSPDADQAGRDRRAKDNHYHARQVMQDHKAKVGTRHQRKYRHLCLPARREGQKSLNRICEPRQGDKLGKGSGKNRQNGDKGEAGQDKAPQFAQGDAHVLDPDADTDEVLRRHIDL